MSWILWYPITIAFVLGVIDITLLESDGTADVIVTKLVQIAILFQIIVD